MNKKYLIETWGCQMNEEDSEKIAGMLKNIGYEETIKILDTKIIIKKQNKIKWYSPGNKTL